MAETADMPPSETPAEPRAAQRQRMLARLADHALELACDLQQAALAATEPQAKVRYALGFHHVGRTMRQTLALEARLERDAARDHHETVAREQARATQAAATRKAQVQAGVERLIWTEHEPQEAEVWTADLAERLDDEALQPGFTDEAVDDHIDRAARELGLTGDEAHPYVPRALRQAALRRPARPPWRALIDALEFDDEDDDAEPDDQPAPAEPRPVFDAAPSRVLAPPPPPPAPRPPAPEAPLSPEPAILAPPPPDPPPPEPYVPPWERLRPGAVFPGGSGY